MTRYLNAYKGQIYPKSPHNIQLKYFNKKETSSGNLEDSVDDLLGRTDNTTAVNSIAETPIAHTS